MLEALGIKESTEAVYRLLLERPEYDVTEMAAHLGRPEPGGGGRGRGPPPPPHPPPDALARARGVWRT
ncbi:hypothetical protein ACFV2S_18665, partial [Streptomyces sp. NPDC059695]